MKYIFDIDDGPKVFMEERHSRGVGVHDTHVALRLLCILSMRDLDPLAEPEPGIHHRKFTPDVISGDERTWGEAGYLAKNKLVELAGSRDLDKILVMKSGQQTARTLSTSLSGANRRRKQRIVPITIAGWKEDDLGRMSGLIQRSNSVSVEEPEPFIYELRINDETMRMRAGVWEVPAGEDGVCIRDVHDF